MQKPAGLFQLTSIVVEKAPAGGGAALAAGYVAPQGRDVHVHVELPTTARRYDDPPAVVGGEVLHYLACGRQGDDVPPRRQLAKEAVATTRGVAVGCGGDGRLPRRRLRRVLAAVARPRGRGK